MLFSEQVERLLDESTEFPSHVNLGRISSAFVNGQFVWKGSHAGFKVLTRDQQRQLMRRLQTNSHVVFFNIYGNYIDADTMRDLIEHIAALKGLQCLVLGGAHASYCRI